MERIIPRYTCAGKSGLRALCIGDKLLKGWGRPLEGPPPANLRHWRLSDLVAGQFQVGPPQLFQPVPDPDQPCYQQRHAPRCVQPPTDSLIPPLLPAGRTCRPSTPPYPHPPRQQANPAPAMEATQPKQKPDRFAARQGYRPSALQIGPPGPAVPMSGHGHLTPLASHNPHHPLPAPPADTRPIPHCSPTACRSEPIPIPRSQPGRERPRPVASSILANLWYTASAALPRLVVMGRVYPETRRLALSIMYKPRRQNQPDNERKDPFWPTGCPQRDTLTSGRVRGGG